MRDGRQFEAEVGGVLGSSEGGNEALKGSKGSVNSEDSDGDSARRVLCSLLVVDGDDMASAATGLKIFKTHRPLSQTEYFLCFALLQKETKSNQTF